MPVPLDSSDPTRDAFLEAVFDRAVKLQADGEAISVDALAADRPDLREDVAELIALSREIAVRRPAVRPEVPGYEIERELGRGGMGTVWLARQTRLGGRLVALKTLPAGATAGTRARERFLKESRALSRISHENVVAIHDVVTTLNADAYAMEWINGPSLAELLARLGPRSRSAELSPSDIAEALHPAGAAAGTEIERPIPFFARLGLGVARALSAVHAAGILHRDVKPSNILLRRDGTPLLSDFGLARDDESSFLTRSGSFLGTPSYASPEQLRGDKLNERSDIYSLGVTLYHAFTGRLPFEGKTTFAILRAIEQEAAPPLAKVDPKLPRDLSTIVAKAMELEPKQRYASAAKLADDLERLLELRPIRAVPPGVLRRLAKLTHRNARSVIGAGVGVAVSVLVAALGVLYTFVLPKLAEEQVRLARQELLHSAYPEALHVAQRVAAGETDLVAAYRPIDDSSLPARYDRALAHYDHALRLLPWAEDAALEREVLFTFAELDEFRTRLPAPEANRDRVAVLEAYARAPGPVPEDWQLDGDASAEQIRALGMLAYLRGDSQTSLDAWTELGLEIGTDAWADANVGLLQLRHGQPGPAYARLTAARYAFGEAPLFRAYLADAALLSGDVEQALHVFATVKTTSAQMESPDPYDKIATVAADLAAWEGNFERAIETHARVAMTHLYFRRSLSHMCELSQLQGDWEQALPVLVTMAQRHAEFPSTHAALLRATREAWSIASTHQRREWIQMQVRHGSVFGRSLASMIDENERVSSLSHSPKGDWFDWTVPEPLLERWKSVNPARTNSSPDGERVSLGDLHFTRAILRFEEKVRMQLPISLRVLMAQYAHLTDEFTHAFLTASVHRRLGSALANSLLVNPTRFAAALMIAIGGTGSISAQTPIHVATANAGEQFGRVHAVGDLNADGRPDYCVSDASTNGRGVVYSGADKTILFEKSGDGPGDRFGVFAARIADVNQDGIDDLLLGADQSGVGTGYARIFSGASPWATIDTLSGSNFNDHFGTGPARLDDVNGDGFEDFAVGAEQGSNVTGDHGNGYVRVFSGFDRSLIAQVNGPSFGSRFGVHTKSIPDVDADGVDDIAIGAWTWNNAGNGDEGIVQIFSGDDRTLIHELHAATGTNNFGRDFAVIGDVDGDGIEDLAVSARGFGSVTGWIRMFSMQTGAPLWLAPGAAPGDQLWQVESIFDLDGDGVRDVVGGANQANNGGPGYVRFYSGGNMGAEITIDPSPIFGELNGDRFANSVANLGDVDGDGLEDIAVTAGGPDKVYVYNLLPNLTGDTNALSLSAGGTLTLSIDAGTANANSLYWVFGSATGTFPGLPTQLGKTLPLNLDPFFQLTLTRPFAGIFGNFLAFLDGNGEAIATFTLPAGADPGLDGVTLHFAYVAAQTFGQIDFVSNAVFVDLIP